MNRGPVSIRMLIRRLKTPMPMNARLLAPIAALISLRPGRWAVLLVWGSSPGAGGVGVVGGGVTSGDGGGGWGLILAEDDDGGHGGGERAARLSANFSSLALMPSGKWRRRGSGRRLRCGEAAGVGSLPGR